MGYDYDPAAQCCRELNEIIDMVKNIEKVTLERNKAEARSFSSTQLFGKVTFDMLWWNKIESAAEYLLELYVLDDNKRIIIDTISIPRNKSYYSFEKLSRSFKYALVLKAISRENKEIDSVEIEL